MAQKPLILTVETSGRTGSVAIAIGPQLLAEAFFTGPMRHSAEIFPVTQSLLRKFDRKPGEIEHIYISAGPGSFTGLRIAVTFAKTMHLANAVKIVAVDTLDVIAANVIENQNSRIERVAAILDAKRSQFFTAVYQRNTNPGTQADKPSGWEKILPDSLMTAPQFTEQFACKAKPVWLLGEGLVYYKDKFEMEGICFFEDSAWYPQASKVHLLGWKKAQAGQFAEPLTLQPTYLRKPDFKPQVQE